MGRTMRLFQHCGIDVLCPFKLQTPKRVIEECFALISTKPLHKEGRPLDDLTYSHMSMTMDVGQRSCVLHCYSKQCSGLELSGALHHDHFASFLCCARTSADDLLKELAIKTEDLPSV